MTEEQTGRGPENPEKESIDEQFSDDRRRVLKKLGIYALYTPPILLATLEAAKAAPCVSGVCAQ
jgi:hypothetical protein